MHSKDPMYSYVQQDTYRMAGSTQDRAYRGGSTQDRPYRASIANPGDYRPMYRHGSPAFRRKGRLKRRG